MPPIKNKSVLVIGGSAGIGYSVADGALAEGARVRIASSSAARVQKSVETLKQKYPEGDIEGQVCDLTSQGVEQHLEKLLESVKPLDHVVFTAGDPIPIKPLPEITLEEIHKAGHIRFAVPLLLAKLLPRYITPGYQSSLTLTTGAAADKPFPNWSLIGGYLTGIKGLVRNLALDLKPLRVNVVSPGAVSTSFLGPDGAAEKYKDYTTLGKIGTPEEVAEAYLYIMKDTNITGSTISTNSGSLLV